LIRQESRGAHYRTDFPHAEEGWRRHIVFRHPAS
jgi:aspartate oxidase